jgi:SAM-dependent methyltransferase
MATQPTPDAEPAGMPGYGPATYGDGFADVYDDWYAGVSPPEATARFLAARTAGPVLELGSGTGRLAGPIRAAGLPVIGLDASSAMLARSRSRHPDVPVVAADMAELPARPGSFGAVLVAFNTLLNLPSAALQRRCLARARAAIGPDGVVVVEAFVPGSGAEERADRVDVVRLDAQLVVLRVSRTDPVSGIVQGHHIELRDGAPVRLRPWQVRVTSPEELDQLADRAGLVRAERFAGWEGEPYTDDSLVHVTVYRPRHG